MPKAKHCFEISWEVCNKVGGIYTVVASKARQMIKHYGDGYIAVGPYFPKKAFGTFEEILPPEAIKNVFDRLRNDGIDCHYGNWLVTGSPKVILIDFTRFTEKTNNIKKEFWDNYGLDTLGTTYYDVDEPLIWSYAAGTMIAALSEVLDGQGVAHCHEWLAGGALLRLKSTNVATVFTTHATMLGRTLVSDHVNIYDQLDTINPEAEAHRRGQGLWSKWQIEHLCANNADIFTTVSEITGIEATRLLGRKPEVLLFNGLDMAKFPTFEECSVRHKLFKSKLFEFIMYTFFPYYTFDLNNTLIFFLSGRYEFHDKGIDVFIRALGRLNDKLKDEKSNMTIVAFIFVPGNIRGIKAEMLENRTMFFDVHDFVHDDINDIANNIIRNIIGGRDVAKGALFDEDSMQEVKRKVLRFKKKGQPPVCTHDLYDENQDAILNTLINAGLDNMEDDKVKAIYYPIYLTGADGLLNVSYYESMQGGHLGVFPSIYEPWGYTPLEAAALGVPSITSDLAGFGRRSEERRVGKEC